MTDSTGKVASGCLVGLAKLYFIFAVVMASLFFILMNALNFPQLGSARIPLAIIGSLVLAYFGYMFTFYPLKSRPYIERWLGPLGILVQKTILRKNRDEIINESTSEQIQSHRRNVKVIGVILLCISILGIWSVIDRLVS